MGAAGGLRRRRERHIIVPRHAIVVFVFQQFFDVAAGDGRIEGAAGHLEGAVGLDALRAVAGQRQFQESAGENRLAGGLVHVDAAGLFAGQRDVQNAAFDRAGRLLRAGHADVFDRRGRNDFDGAGELVVFAGHIDAIAVFLREGDGDFVRAAFHEDGRGGNHAQLAPAARIGGRAVAAEDERARAGNRVGRRCGDGPAVRPERRVAGDGKRAGHREPFRKGDAAEPVRGDGDVPGNGSGEHEIFADARRFVGPGGGNGRFEGEGEIFDARDGRPSGACQEKQCADKGGKTDGRTTHGGTFRWRCKVWFAFNRRTRRGFILKNFSGVEPPCRACQKRLDDSFPRSPAPLSPAW